MTRQRKGSWWPFLVAIMGAMLVLGACTDGADVVEVAACRGAAKCGESCVNLATDPSNCGTCGTTCEVGLVCAGGMCGVACIGGTTECQDSCANLDVDPQNCGSCGNTCPGGTVCSLGQCAVACGGGTTECDGVCVDMDFDVNNCGLCSNKCYPGQDCLDGNCLLLCGGGTSECDGECVNFDHDRQNCGGCDVVCDADQVCAAGNCAKACVGNTTDCSGSCLDLDIDPSNCGGCGNACNAGEVCSQGNCQLACGGGTTQCGDLCINTDVDPTNCGMCGMDCGGNSICDMGSCVTVSSCLGATECAGECVNLQIDSNHCGMCGMACAAGSYCSAGNCVNATGTCDLFLDTFADNSAGWTLGPEWGFGSAQFAVGGSCGNGDPAFDHTPNGDNGVMGVNIGGHVAIGLHANFYYLVSPPVDTSMATDVYFEFWRFLNSDFVPYMQNIIEVYDGTNWQQIFITSDEIEDSSWQQQLYNVTAFKNPAMQVRFGFNVNDNGVYNDCGGWNIDDVRLFTTSCP